MTASTVAKIVAGALVGAGAIASCIRTTDGALRPPGARDEADFLSKCIKCGRCIEACPYGAAYALGGIAGPAVGTPTIDARLQACRLCEDLPCIAACPTGALEQIDDRRDVRMGLAVIDRDLCIAVKALRCEVCYRACPLIDEAIRIDYKMRDGDAIHSVFEPVIDVDKCTGCGLCVERCVVSDPRVAIRIVRDRDEALAAIDAEKAKNPDAYRLSEDWGSNPDAYERAGGSGPRDMSLEAARSEGAAETGADSGSKGD